MTEDQIGFFLVTGLAMATWATWYRRLFLFPALHRACWHRLSLSVGPVLCLGFIAHSLPLLFGSPAQGRLLTQLIFLSASPLCLRGLMVVLAAFGLDALEDGLERKNVSAILVVYGLWIAGSCCLTGTAFGVDDSFGASLKFLVMALSPLTLVIVVFAAFTRGLIAITVERDFAAGLRFTGLLVACGFVLGHLVLSGPTWTDFLLQIWPVGVILAVGLIVETLSPVGGPSSNFFFIVRTGLIPAAGYLALAAFALQGLPRFARL